MSTNKTNTEDRPIEVTYRGGPLDCQSETSERKHFQEGKFPVATIEVDGENHLYESWELFHHDTMSVEVHHCGSFSAAEGAALENEDDSYEWMAPEDRYQSD